MKFIENAAPVSLIFACVLLAAGFLQAGEMAGVWAAIGLGGVWVFGQQMVWRWIHSIGLILYFGLASAGAFLEMSPLWLVAGAVVVLAGWDSAGFLIRIEGFGGEVHHENLSQRYLIRIAMVAGLGAGLGTLAVLIQIKLSFGWAFLLGLVALWGLGQTIRYLRRESD